MTNLICFQRKRQEPLFVNPEEVATVNQNYSNGQPETILTLKSGKMYSLAEYAVDVVKAINNPFEGVRKSETAAKPVGAKHKA